MLVVYPPTSVPTFNRPCHLERNNFNIHNTASIYQILAVVHHEERAPPGAVGLLPARRPMKTPQEKGVAMSTTQREDDRRELEQGKWHER